MDICYETKQGRFSIKALMYCKLAPYTIDLVNKFLEIIRNN